MTSLLRGAASKAVLTCMLLILQPLIVPIASAQDATAPNATRTLDIAAGPLNRTLKVIATAYGVSVFASDALIEGRQADAIKGRYDVDGALSVALLGTGLAASGSTGGSYVIVASPAASSSGESDFNDMNAQSDTQIVEEMIVYGRWEPFSATGTKMDISILDTPASVQIVPQEVIDTQNAINLSDVVRNISGVQNDGSSGNRFDRFNLRGFRGDRLAKDGLLGAASFGEAGLMDLANIERVEVLKGPNSVLYGQNEPGGLINLVTKKPEQERFYVVDATYGTFDFARFQLDVNQPITEDGKLLFRLNTAYQDTNSFRDHLRDSERIIVAPSLRWSAAPDTVIDLQVEYYDQEQPNDRGIVQIDGDAQALPRERYLGEEFSISGADEIRFSALVNHRLNQDWSINGIFRFTDSDSFQFSADARGLQDDGRTLNRRVGDFRQAFETYSAQVNLTGRFSTGPINHAVLAGLDVGITRLDAAFVTAPLDPIDVFNPVYGAQPGEFGSLFERAQDIESYGAYFQNLIAFTDQLKVMLGGRFDIVNTDVSSGERIITNPDDHEFSPRAGILFQPVEDLSLYASYTESFIPLFLASSSEGTSAFDPETGQQTELGVKRVWGGGLLTTSLSVFELTRQNVLQEDPDNPDLAIQTGEQRSRGVEVDISGELTEGWNIIATLTYLDTEITEDLVLEVGNEFQNVPEWAGSLWTTYAFQEGAARGFELGAGLFFVTERQGDFENTFKADGYTRVDAFARYSINERIEFLVNIDNVFDEDFIEVARGDQRLYPGASQSVFGRVRLKF